MPSGAHVVAGAAIAAAVAACGQSSPGGTPLPGAPGGSETVIDAATGAPRGTVEVGGEAGNVAYDPATRRMLVDVQTRNQLAVIDPATETIIRRIALPGCDHDHGLTIDSPDRLAFIACDGNAALLTLDLNTWRVTDTATVGDGPDVLAYDPRASRLYVAAESRQVAVLQRHDRRIGLISLGYLADNAHVVAMDPGTGRSAATRLSWSARSRSVTRGISWRACGRAIRASAAAGRERRRRQRPTVRRSLTRARGRGRRAITAVGTSLTAWQARHATG